MSEAKCECGGVCHHYDGALGYEAMVCEQCNEHWWEQTEEKHLAHVEQYKKGERNGGPGRKFDTIPTKNFSWYFKKRSGRFVAYRASTVAINRYVALYGLPDESTWDYSPHPTCHPLVDEVYD